MHFGSPCPLQFIYTLHNLTNLFVVKINGVRHDWSQMLERPCNWIEVISQLVVLWSDLIIIVCNRLATRSLAQSRLGMSSNDRKWMEPGMLWTVSSCSTCCYTTWEPARLVRQDSKPQKKVHKTYRNHMKQASISSGNGLKLVLGK